MVTHQPKLINQSVIRLINIRRPAPRLLQRRYVTGRLRQGCGRIAMDGHDICYSYCTLQPEQSRWTYDKNQTSVSVSHGRGRQTGSDRTSAPLGDAKLPDSTEELSVVFPIGRGRRSTVSVRERSTGRYVFRRRRRFRRALSHCRVFRRP